MAARFQFKLRILAKLPESGFSLSGAFLWCLCSKCWLVYDHLRYYWGSFTVSLSCSGTSSWRPHSNRSWVTTWGAATGGRMSGMAQSLLPQWFRVQKDYNGLPRNSHLLVSNISRTLLTYTRKAGLSYKIWWKLWISTRVAVNGRPRSSWWERKMVQWGSVWATVSLIVSLIRTLFLYLHPTRNVP